MSDRLAFLCKILRGYAVEVTVRANPPPRRKTQHVPTETDVALPPDHAHQLSSGAVYEGVFSADAATDDKVSARDDPRTARRARLPRPHRSRSHDNRSRPLTSKTIVDETLRPIRTR